MEWSKYQEEIFEHCSEYTDHLQVIARAGAGKTTTIVEASKRLEGRVLLCAFNKRIQLALAEKVDQGTDVLTLHSLGLRAYNKSRPGARIDVKGEKVKGLIRECLLDIWGSEGNADDRAAIRKLVSLAKNTLKFKIKDLEELAFLHGVASLEFPAQQVAQVTQAVLEQCKANRMVIDFDDMVWLPALESMKVAHYDTILVDESQDLNLAQRTLIKLAKPEQVVSVGDPAQAIYGWRGADADAMQLIAKDFPGESVELPITYRCAKSITKLAQKLVPSIQCPDDAPEGRVEYCGKDVYLNAGPEDFILSRTNAALVTACLGLLSRGKPAFVVGRDIGIGLKAIINKSKQHYTTDFLVWLNEHEKKKVAYYIEKDQQDAAIKLQDQCAALRVLSAGHTTTAETNHSIDALFKDKAKGITCSTVHKAKGLEADTVWMLAYTFLYRKTQEELNIVYVGITRAKTRLVLCGKLKI